MVDAELQDDGVVQRPFREAAIAIGSLRHRRPLALQRREQPRPLLDGHSRRIGGFEARQRTCEKLREGDRVVPLVRHPSGRIGLAAPAEERHGAAEADEGGERLGERRLPGRVARRVQQLVKDEIDEILAAETELARQQRIVEPAQGAEAAGGANVRVVALGLESRGLATRKVEVEEALVGHATDDREPPGVGLQPEALGGADDVDDRRVVVARQRRVAAAGAQPELPLGKVTRGQHEFELRTLPGIDGAGREDLLDRLPAPEDARFLVAGTQHVGRRASREQHREQEGQRQAAAPRRLTLPLPDHPRPPQPRRSRGRCAGSPAAARRCRRPPSVRRGCRPRAPCRAGARRCGPPLRS